MFKMNLGWFVASFAALVLVVGVTYAANQKSSISTAKAECVCAQCCEGGVCCCETGVCTCEACACDCCVNKAGCCEKGASCCSEKAECCSVPATTECTEAGACSGSACSMK
ncbi:hypothetical protein VN12_22390 [Pirellula sp. SH-Sr6A]|nr:hypothetical protein VN12_22390 [Pirellula sp. SH-Sr6A]